MKFRAFAWAGLHRRGRLNDKYRMSVRETARLAGAALRDGVASLSDVSPVEFEVLPEESDWGLVGGDLRDAMEEAQPEVDEPVDDRTELVEA